MKKFICFRIIYLNNIYRGFFCIKNFFMCGEYLGKKIRFLILRCLYFNGKIDKYI